MAKRSVKRQEERRALARRQRLMLGAALGLAALGIVALLAVIGLSGDDSGGVTVEVIVPAELSAEARQGAALFQANCQACHGPNASGTKLGPPLIHDIYNPGHHSDDAFYLAAATGVRQHHWQYGDMPAQPQVTRADVGLIIRFVRELQEANGIERKAY